MTAEDAVIFSSSNGVRAAPAGAGRRAYCIGKATTEAALERGWMAEQSGIDADTLVTSLTQSKPSQHLFHLSGVHTRGDIVARLTAAGLTAQNVAVYDQRLRDLTDEAATTIAQEPRVIVPLFSPRTAAQFAKSAPRTTSVHVIALSTAVADVLGAISLAGLTVAHHPNAQAMGAALNGLD